MVQRLKRKSAEPTNPKIEGAESTRRTLQLLSLLALPGPAKTLVQLAEAAGLTKSTAYRLLRVLQEENFVDRQEPGGYHFGSKFFQLAVSVIPELELYELIKPLLQEVADATRETVTVHRRLGSRTVLVFGVESQEHLLRFVVRAGDMMPIVRGCSGRAILAFLDAPEIAHIVAREPTVRKHPAFQRLLAETRRQGFSLSYGENIPGLHGIGMPVIARKGDAPVFSLVISGPAGRWTTKRMIAYAPKLAKVAKALARLLAAKTNTGVS